MKSSLCLILILSCIPVTADTDPSGEALFEKHCSECHAKDGNSSDNNIPRIAQFSAILVYDILDQFKSADRKAQKVTTKDGESTDMTSIAKALNSAEIEAISHYLSTQTSKPVTQEYDKQLAEQGQAIHMDLCENCHVENGTSPIEDTPLLRGQWKPYLIKQFAAFSNQERDMPKRMRKRFRKLSAEEKQALIEFYSSPIFL